MEELVAAGLFSCAYINEEHLETTAPIDPCLFLPLFQKRKKIGVFSALFAFPVSLIWVIA